TLDVMAKKIAHFIRDQKFCDAAYSAFEEALPGGNVFFLPENGRALKFIKRIDPVSISRYAFLNPLFIRRLREFDLIVFHALSSFNAEVALRVAGKVKSLWIGMGYDYYDLIYEKYEDMLKPETRKYYSSSRGGGMDGAKKGF